MISEELYFLDSKVLNYLKSRKITTLTYAELETLIRPYKVEDYILCSRILYEPQSGIFKLLPDLEKELFSSSQSHDGRGRETTNFYRKREEVSGERVSKAGEREGRYSNGVIKRENFRTYGKRDNIRA